MHPRSLIYFIYEICWQHKITKFYILDFTFHLNISRCPTVHYCTRTHIYDVYWPTPAFHRILLVVFFLFTLFTIFYILNFFTSKTKMQNNFYNTLGMDLTLDL